LDQRPIPEWVTLPVINRRREKLCRKKEGIPKKKVRKALKIPTKCQGVIGFSNENSPQGGKV